MCILWNRISKWILTRVFFYFCVAELLIWNIYLLYEAYLWQLNSDNVIYNNLYWLPPKAFDLLCMRINENHMKVNKFLIVHDIFCSLILDFSKHSKVLASLIEGDRLQKCKGFFFFFFLASDNNPNLTHFHKSLVWKSVIKWHKSTTFFLVVFGVSKLDYLLNVQGSIFAWRVHHMSDKSHALEMKFTAMKSRVTAYSFLYHGSKIQSSPQK